MKVTRDRPHPPVIKDVSSLQLYQAGSSCTYDLRDHLARVGRRSYSEVGYMDGVQSEVGCINGVP